MTTITEAEVEQASLSAGDVSVYPAGDDATSKWPQPVAHASGPAHVQAVCRFSGRQSGTEPGDLEKYRNLLNRSGRIDELFEVFKEQPLAHGYALTSRQIVDSSIVGGLRQRKRTFLQDTDKNFQKKI